MANRSLRKSLANILTGNRIAQDVTDELKRVTALKNLSLSIQDNHSVGLIGSNGSGKTTLLRVMAGVLKPASGYMRRVGVTAPLFDVSLGMNGEASGYDNIILKGLFLGLSSTQAKLSVQEIVKFCDLSHEQLLRPVRTYSSGMMMKLAFAISTSINPEVLLLDEWIGVGDAQFLDKAHSRMTDLVDKSRILVIASHQDQLIRSLCTKAVYLRKGEIIGFGPVDEMLGLYHQQG